MRRIVLPVLAGIASFSAGAFAADTMIHQKGRVFSTEAITIAKGDSLTFVNDDSVPHNVMSTSPGNEFNLGSLKPGTATPVTFAEAGEATVICAIHPRMKMKVMVTQ
jgi:plastocyanin